MRRQRIFDAHCDTVLEILEQDQSLRKNSLHLDLERLGKYDGYIQVFAMFIDQKGIHCSPVSQCVSMLHRMREELEKNQDVIALIQSCDDLEDVVREKKIGAMLSIEGGEALEGKLSNLWMYYQLGVRLITLTWNYANEIADGITETRGGGLTAFGKTAVRAMEDMGILIDVSHLSVQGFWDVAENTRYPFVASHSCVKALCDHPRNLDDEQIRFMITRKGGIGINFFPEFLSEKKECGVSDILRHMEYILDLGGQDVLGMGSDFDGVSYLPNGISGVESVEEVINAMKQKGWTQTQIDAICFGNFYRIFCNTLGRRK